MHDHTGLTFPEIEELPIDEYLLLRRDAYIFMLNQSEEGRKYLERCWILEQKEPDRKILREKFGKKRG